MSEEINFEKAMEKLEQIVEKLEQEEIPLEKAIEYYQEGMNYSKLCSDKLRRAEENMTKILNENNETIPFDIQEEE